MTTPDHKPVDDGHFVCSVCGRRVVRVTRYVKTIEGSVERCAPRTHVQHAAGAWVPA